MSKNEGEKSYKRYKVSDVRYFAAFSWISDHLLPLTSTANTRFFHKKVVYKKVLIDWLESLVLEK